MKLIINFRKERRFESYSPRLIFGLFFVAAALKVRRRQGRKEKEEEKKREEKKSLVVEVEVEVFSLLQITFSISFSSSLFASSFSLQQFTQSCSARHLSCSPLRASRTSAASAVSLSAQKKEKHHRRCRRNVENACLFCVDSFPIRLQ